MKKVGIFYGFRKGRLDQVNSDDLFGNLKTALNTKNCEALKFGLADLCVQIVKSSLKITDSYSGLDLKELDAVYFANWRTYPEMAMAVTVYARRHNIEIINAELENFPARTKLGELVKMSDHDIPLPDSYILRNKRLIKRVGTKKVPFKYPFIAKAVDGMGGSSNYLVNGDKALVAIIQKNPELTFVLQTFIPNKFDYRIIVLGGEVTTVIKRTRQTEDNHVNNTSKGALGELVETKKVDKEILQLAVKAATAVGRPDFAGADILINGISGRPYVLEVNKSPQIGTGTNIAAKLEAMATFLDQKARLSWQKKQN